jgi:hypothetical protein
MIIKTHSIACRKLAKAQRHIKDIAGVSRSQEELNKLWVSFVFIKHDENVLNRTTANRKDQLQKQKEGIEGHSLVWEETKLKLKLASEESESLVRYMSLIEIRKLTLFEPHLEAKECSG